MLRARATAFAERPADESLRPSGLYYLCPRRMVLAKHHEGKTAEPPDGRVMASFSVGTAIHTMFQDDFLPGMATVGARLVGSWKCSGCGFVTDNLEAHSPPGEGIHAPLEEPDGPSTRRKTCWITTVDLDGCETRAPGRFSYIEPSFRDAETGMRGKCDGILEIGGERWVLELKSARHEVYAKLEGPKPDHVFQANIYMRYFNVPRAIIVYFDKDTHWSKEFHVTSDPEIQEQITARVRDYHVAKNSGVLTDRICLTPEDPQAKRCSHVDACFSNPAVAIRQDAVAV